MRNILIAALFFTSQLTLAAGKIQNEDVKSLSELTAAGGTAAQLINDSKVYVTANNVNQQLSTAIANGLIGGSGTKNYLSGAANGTFEQNSTSGWSLFNTTITGTLPVGAVTAGAASVTTFAATASGKIAGNYSLNTASSGAWGAGQGFISNAFTIDAEDQAKVLSFKGAFSVQSGAANINLSGTVANTFHVYIYDVTNSAWIQPAGVYSMTQSSGVGYISGTFQTTANSTQYRLAVLAIPASGGAVSVNWDSMFVGPQALAYGAFVSDWQPYTPTFTGFGTVSNINMQSRRVGGDLEVIGYFQAGTPTATLASMTLGYAGGNGNVSVDGSKIGATVQLGTANTQVSSATFFAIAPITSNPVGSSINFSAQTSSTYLSSPANGNAVTITGSYIEVNFKVPITGWSSSQVLSSDASTRVVAMNVNSGSPTASLSGSFSLIKFTNAPNVDTAGSYSTTTGLFTAPVSGTYSVTGSVGIGGTYSLNQGNGISIFKNGNQYATNYVFAGGANTQLFGQVSTQVYLLAGETIGLYANSSATSPTINANPYVNFLNVNLIQGPAQIAASESVNARYYTTAGQSIANGSTTAVVVFGTKSYDSHNAFNPTTGIFTAPVSGIYSVNSNIAFTANATGRRGILLGINGSSYITGLVLQATASGNINLNSAFEFKLLAGETLDIRAYQDSGGALSLYSGGGDNWINISRVGN
jgi:hypothetical protein